MPELLKTMFFTKTSIAAIAAAVSAIHPPFDTVKFTQLVYHDKWDSLELKEKMRHVTTCLNQTLPPAFPDAVKILMEAAPNIKGFEAMCLPDYAEIYGTDHHDWETAMEALECFTRYSSSEFSVRPFLDKDPQQVLGRMLKWADSPHAGVRRCASEGTRPRLPWAMALPKFKKDPTPIIPILEKLKNDPSETVRRSVANNLNDISKDNPQITLDLCEKWHGQTENTDALIKHALRTLLKQGNKRALILFGFSDPAHIVVENLELEKKTIAIGDEVYFSFNVTVNETRKTKLRLEYLVDFAKAKGKRSQKVFQIIEKEYEPGTHSLKRKHSFKNMTTRKHYPGAHHVTILTNGEEKATATLQLESGS